MTDTIEGLAEKAAVTLPADGMALAWRWSPEAVQAALEHTGTPPKLNIQAMLSAAFAVDGPNLTAMVFQVAIGDRIEELDANPTILDVANVTSVELSGQFLLMLLSGRLDLLKPTVKHVEHPTPEHDHGTDGTPA